MALFFFNDTATTEIYTLSLHDALPIWFDVLAELRRRDETRDVGVLLLTARKDEPDRIKGLSLGADDYLAKPFSPKELVLRVGAILRRLAAPPVSAGGRLVGGPIVLDRTAH